MIDVYQRKKLPRKILNRRLRERAAHATVRVSPKGKGGLGVLVPGGFILTAAHCITWDGDGRMALGDYFLETIVSKVTGAKFRADVYAAEPVADIAVLGRTDAQDLYDDAIAFEEFCEATEAVPLRVKPLSNRKPYRGHVLTQFGTWITGAVTCFGFPGDLPRGRAWIELPKPITGGNSGGPVVDDDGRLIGVIVQSGCRAGQDEQSGLLPVARLALPRWVSDKILAAQKSK